MCLEITKNMKYLLLEPHFINEVCEIEGVKTLGEIDHEEFFKKHFTRRVSKDVNNLSGQTKYREYYEMSDLAKKICKQIHSSISLRFEKSLKNKISDFKRSATKSVFVHARYSAKNTSYYFPRFYYLPDIKSAFPTTLFTGCLQVLGTKFGQDNDLSKLIQLFCFEPNGGLVVGQSASNIIFQVYCANTIDIELEQICEEHKIVCTRYVDDFLFSAQKPFDLSLRKKIISVIRKAGYEINFKKTRVMDLAKSAININGIVLRKEANYGAIGISKSYRHTLYKFVTFGENNHNKVAGKFNLFLELLKLKRLKKMPISKNDKDIEQLFKRRFPKLKKSKKGQSGAYLYF